MQTVTRLIVPLLALLALEIAFRGGLWERMTPKDSHAGTSARVVLALQQWPDKIDFVTIGSSRPKHALDHQLIAAAAGRHGLVHANLSIPGAHALTETLLLKYLEKNRRELQGGIFAIALSDLLYLENGNYEIAIAQPLSNVFDRPEDLLQRFHLSDSSSWGAISSLYQYRKDIQNFLRHPLLRIEELRSEPFSPALQLFSTPIASADVCGMDFTTLKTCSAYSGGDTNYQNVAKLCAEWLPSAGKNPNWVPFANGPVPPELQAVLAFRQAQFRSIHWHKLPLVILLPVDHLWYREIAPRGVDGWAHRVLDPLVEEGSIRLLDYSHFFDTTQGSRCDVFADPYHQSALGRRELTAELLPKIEKYLYSADDETISIK
jgi:hypothetical protein